MRLTKSIQLGEITLILQVSHASVHTCLFVIFNSCLSHKRRNMRYVATFMWLRLNNSVGLLLLFLGCVQDHDGAEPSANSVSASNLLRLSHYTGRQEWLQTSQQLLAAFSDRLTSIPIALPEMIRALMAHHYTLKQIVICGQREASDTAGLLAALNSLFSPFKVVMHTDGNPESFLCQRLPALSSMTQLDGAATAYVCQDLTCSLPVTEPQDLRQLLLDRVMAQEDH